MEINSEAESRLRWLADRAARCRLCEVMAQRKAVLGPANGPRAAEVMFIAEAPGRLGADRTGVPLSGDRSGLAFEKLLAAAGWRRDKVYVTNAVLCNPRDQDGRNRRPNAVEIRNCSPLLEAQIGAVDPKIIVSLGTVALAALKVIEDHGLEQSRDAGAPHRWCGRILVPLYHPSPRAWRWRSPGRQAADFEALASLPEARRVLTALRART